MTTQDRPDSGDLEARWEAVLRGEAGPEEAAAVRREAAAQGRAAEFEAQAEVSAAVRGLTTRYEAPEALRRRASALRAAEGSRRPAALWWAAAAGALAASLLMAAGLGLLRRPAAPAPDPFRLAAREARAEYQRARIDPRPIQSGNPRLERVLRWFEKKVDYRPRVYFPGNEETALEGGRVGYVEGRKVPAFLYRWQGKTILLTVFEAKKHPAWAAMPRRKWTPLTDAAPEAYVWRRGDFIYTLVGDAPEAKMREIARAVTPREKKF